mgnify:CR=1 FL=1
MSSRCLLRLIFDPELPSGSTRVQWYCPQLSPEVQRGESDIASLPAFLGAQRCVLLLPAERCTRLSVELPARSVRQFEQALPFAVEELLAQDIETLKLAHGPRGADGRWPVTALDARMLRAVLAALAEAGIEPEWTQSEQDAVPVDPSGWTVLIDGARALVSTGAHEGFACAVDELPQWLAQTSSTRTATPNVYLVRSASRPDTSSALSPDLLQGAQVREIDDALRFMAGHLGLGGVRVQRRVNEAGLRVALRPWRMAAALAVVLLGVQMAVTVTQTWQAQREASRLAAESERLFREALPDVQRIVNLRAQMQQRLARAGASLDGDGFTALLADVAPRLVQSRSLSVQRLSYRAGRLEIALKGARYADMEALLVSLRELPGLQVELSGSAGEGGEAEGRLAIRSAQAGVRPPARPTAAMTGGRTG